MKFVSAWTSLAVPILSVSAFAPNSIVHRRISDDLHVRVLPTTTQLQATKKQSMKQRRKKRGQKFVPKRMERPAVLSEVPRADQWDKVETTEEKVKSMKKQEEETKAKAKALIDSQKESVEALTHVRIQIESLDVSEMAKALSSSSYAVFDNVLGEEMSHNMRMEGRSMFDENKLELDLSSGITGGEFAAAIKGGQEQYLDCPRSIEFVVSMTRHLPAMLNKIGKKGDDDGNENGMAANFESLPYVLDETASMAGIRVFDRKSRMSSLAMLTGKTMEDMEQHHDDSDLEPKPFSCIVNSEGMTEEGTPDLRRITVLYFATPDGWDEECGGGVTFQNANGEDVTVAAKNDRLVLFSSEDCSHRMEPWSGAYRESGGDSGGLIVTHLVRERQ